MRKIVLAVLALFSFAAQADELSTFNDIATVISKGKPVTFVISFKKCSSQMPLPPIVASITPNAIMIVDNKRITASDRHFTLDDPVARDMPVFDYSKFNIDSDGASIKMTMINASNYEILGSHLISCGLGEGFKVFG